MDAVPHYLDHAATTPPRRVALEAFAAAHTGANPSSLHGAGRRARRLLEEAREEIAALLGAHPSEVVFTSGGTESDNLAVLGAARHALARGRRPRLLVSAIEHHSVLDAAAQAGREGAQVTVLSVTDDGRCDPATIPAACQAAARTEAAGDRQEPLHAAVMLANNENGAINPVAAIAEQLAEHGGTLHTDAVQAVGHIPVDFAALGASTLSVSGHKFGAPLGIGALLVRREAALAPLGFGGGQERELRSGTVNVPGAVAMAAALREACAELDSEAARLAALRDRLISGIEQAVPDVRLSGPRELGGWSTRLPGNAHLVFPGRAGESLLMLLDAEGICVSTGSACTAGVAEPSHVLLACGYSAADSRAALRITLGHTSGAADVAAVVGAIGAVAERARTSAVITSRLRPGRGNAQQ